MESEKKEIIIDLNQKNLKERLTILSQNKTKYFINEFSLNTT